MGKSSVDMIPATDHFIVVNDVRRLKEALVHVGLRPAGKGYDAVAVQHPADAGPQYHFRPTHPGHGKVNTVLTLSRPYEPVSSGDWLVMWPSLAGGSGDVAECLGKDGWRLRRTLAYLAVRDLLQSAAWLNGWTVDTNDSRTVLLPDSVLQLRYTIKGIDEQMATIIFTIDKQGNVVTEVEGGEGQSCKTLTAAYEQALGMVDSEQLKPEYHQETVAQATVNA